MPANVYQISTTSAFKCVKLGQNVEKISANLSNMNFGPIFVEKSVFFSVVANGAVQKCVIRRTLARSVCLGFQMFSDWNSKAQMCVNFVDFEDVCKIRVHLQNRFRYSQEQALQNLLQGPYSWQVHCSFPPEAPPTPPADAAGQRFKPDSAEKVKNLAMFSAPAYPPASLPADAAGRAPAAARRAEIAALDGRIAAADAALASDRRISPFPSRRFSQNSRGSMENGRKNAMFKEDQLLLKFRRSSL